MDKLLAFTFLILEKNFRKGFFLNKNKTITNNELAILLVHNSSSLVNLIYFFYALTLVFISLLPNFISKKIIRKIFSPDFNPITKTLLFYLYHNEY